MPYPVCDWCERSVRSVIFCFRFNLCKQCLNRVDQLLQRIQFLHPTLFDNKEPVCMPKSARKMRI